MTNLSLSEMYAMIPEEFRAIISPHGVDLPFDWLWGMLLELSEAAGRAEDFDHSRLLMEQARILKSASGRLGDIDYE